MSKQPAKAESAKAAAAEAPACAGPDFNPRMPVLRLPAHACDTHAHIMGPKDKHAYSPERVYTPPDCLLPDYLYMLDRLGVERAVLVQPSVYGTDNTVMLEAMKAAGDRFRGVAVVEDDIKDDELKDLDRAGVRGLRVNIVDVKDRKAGSLPLAQLRKLAERIQPLGWHMEFLMHADEFSDLDRSFADFPVEIVLGHLGYMKTEKGLDDASPRKIRALLGEAHRPVPDLRESTAVFRCDALRTCAARSGGGSASLGHGLAARHAQRHDAQRRGAGRSASDLDSGAEPPLQGAGAQSGTALPLLGCEA